MKIGIISDTHKLIRPEALNALAGVDAIIHAGDIGDEKVLHALEAIAPLTAIRGNIDTQAWCRDLPDTRQFTLGGFNFLLTHNIKLLDIEQYPTPNILIYGHSHKPEIRQEAQTLYFNPGSAGPRRFKLPICLGLLHLSNEKIQPEIIHLI